MPFTPSQMRDYRRRMAARGICTRCLKRPAAKGMRQCPECREILRVSLKELKREWRSSPRRCPDCGGEKDVDPYRCRRCRDRNRLNWARTQERLRAQGLCRWCGRSMGERLGMRMCQMCAERESYLKRQRRALRG